MKIYIFNIEGYKKNPELIHCQIILIKLIQIFPEYFIDNNKSNLFFAPQKSNAQHTQYLPHPDTTLNYHLSWNIPQSSTRSNQLESPYQYARAPLF